jgi:WD40 repeat protein/tRNA A-37 threonylcarbamoyl transferase component Bud32
MLQRFRCPQGHQWELAHAETLPADSTQTCPVCGQSATSVVDRRSPESDALASSGVDAVAVAETLPTENGARGQSTGQPLGISGYELLDEIGRGGMGVVYKARQIALDRVVALKMVLSGVRAGSDELARFHAEAQAAANLRHPHIVAVYEVGEHQGQHYFSMDYIEGESLAELARRQPLSATQAAECLRKVALAIQFAHDRGVVHRDLKPSNILIDAAGEPHVTDFGLAKRIEPGSELTATGTVLGTPSYMPPEQALGRHDLIGPASDVYALGATLYDLLTGRPPFRGETPVETLRQVVDADPVPPRLLNPGVPRDLETVCLKCLEKDPQRRYASPEVLAEELGRFLNGEPIAARPVSSLERGWRWARRYPARAGLLVTGVALLLATAAFGVGLHDYLQSLRHQASLESANEQLAAAKGDLESANTQLASALEGEKAAVAKAAQANETLDAVLYFRNVASALSAWQDNEIPLALELLEECPAERRQWEWHYVHALCHRDLVTMKHGGRVICVAFRPDGQEIASAGLGSIKLWNAGSGELVQTLAGKGSLLVRCAYDVDGKHLVSASLQEKAVKQWDPITGSAVRAFDVSFATAFPEMVFSQDGQRVAILANYKTLKIWDTGQGKEVATLDAIPASMYGLAFSADHKRIAVCGLGTNPLAIWDAETGKRLISLDPTHKPAAKCVAFSHDGRRLATGGEEDRTIRVWDLETRRPLVELKGHTGPISCLTFSHDGRRLASGSLDRTVKLWDADSGQEILPIKGHTNNITSLAFSPDDTKIATASADGTVKVWDTGSRPEARTFTAPGIKWAAFMPDSQGVVIPGTGIPVTTKTTVKVWNASSGAEVATLIDSEVVRGMASSADARWMATTDPYTTKIWDVQTGRPALTLSGGSVALSANGKYVAVSDRQRHTKKPTIDYSVGIWERATSQLRFSFSKHTGWVRAMAFGPEGERIATASEDGTLRVWDTASGKEHFVLRDTVRGTPCVAFSPDGRRIAGAVDSRFAGPGDVAMIRIWDARTGKELHSIRAHRAGIIGSLAFSPDSQRIASAGGDSTVRLWDVETGEEALTLKGHSTDVRHVVFSPDGRRLASASYDGTVRVWDAGANVTPQAMVP